MFNEYSIDCTRVVIINLKREDVGKYLQAADLGLLIRKNSFVNDIASPIKFAEYISCGVPVFTANNQSDSTRFVKNYGIGFIANINYQKEDYRQIIDVIQKERADFNTKCIKLSNEYFDYDIYKPIYMNLYDEKNCFT